MLLTNLTRLQFIVNKDNFDWECNTQKSYCDIALSVNAMIPDVDCDSFIVRKVYLHAYRAYTVAEIRFSVISDIHFHLIPESLVISDFFTI